MTKNVNQIQLDLLEKLLDAKIATVNGNISNLAKEVDKLNESINGGDQLGLMQRVEANEKNINTLVTKFGFITAIFLFIAGCIQAVIPNMVGKLFSH